MDVHNPRLRRTRRSRRARLGAVAALATLALTGCSAEMQRGYLPGYEDGPVTNMTDRITNLWVGSWIAGLAVGLVVWGLILWCITVYRKRRGDETLPIQFRYHVPLEIMYLVLPLLMIGVLYYYTERDTAAIQDVITEEPDLVVEVYGKQWSWDFNYVEEEVWDSGIHVADVGAPGNPDDLPTLYLPVDERVEIRLQSRDVIHSFWVVDFLYKQDMFPGRSNVFQVVPLREGVYAGKCAEFCGEFHSGMLFNVAVVSREEYDAHIERLRDLGQTGQLGDDLNRLQNRGDAGDIPTGQG